MRHLDSLDVSILAALQENGRATTAELGAVVGLPTPAVARRVARLESEAVIRGYLALLSPAALGIEVTAFVTVMLTHHTPKAIRIFEAAVTSFPEVIEIHLMAGITNFYLLRVTARNLGAYERFLRARLARVRGVAHVHSAFSLSSLKTSPALALSHLTRRTHRRSSTRTDSPQRPKAAHRLGSG